MFHGKEYVYEVYKEKSFSRAAQNLYISQPALSAAIKKIEARIGCCIFDRSTNPVQLTESGAEYVKAVEKIMDIENRFENHLNNLKQPENRPLADRRQQRLRLLHPAGDHYGIYPEIPSIKVDLVESNTPSWRRSYSPAPWILSWIITRSAKPFTKSTGSAANA
jgi:DNA-binding MarR family transcriptional regulator